MADNSQDDVTARSDKQSRSKDRRIQQKVIGQGLRDYFNAVVSEPVPDEFLELLKKMDSRNEGDRG